MATITALHPSRRFRHVIESAARFLALLLLLTSSALCADAPATKPTNPLTEMVKPHPTFGGVDPHGDSWQSMLSSFAQFTHLQFLMRLLVSFTLAVACAWLIAWHPRRAIIGDPLADIEERKALVILGMVGAIVAELSGSSPTLAFVIFGIGALLRFRTVLDNPKLTGKAITVVVIGLACGMGSWAMAVFVTVFSWALIYWLESHVSCRIKVRLEGDEDPQPMFGAMQSVLISRHCQLQRSTVNGRKGQMEFLLLIPASMEPRRLEGDLLAQLPKSVEAHIEIEAV